MASIAYEDPDRLIQKHAHTCTINDIGKEYYCWNKECSARLYVRALKSALSTHFYTPDKHEGWCKDFNLRFNPTNYSEVDFDFNNVIKNILSGLEKPKKQDKLKITKKGDGKTIALSNIGQIYAMCKCHRPDQKYNSFEIWRILFDCRSNDYLKYGIFNEHLVECYFVDYQSGKNYIYLKYPLYKELPNQYDLRIYIKNTNLYNKILNKIRNSKKLPIVIAGDWKKLSFNYFQCEVNSGRQIFLPCDRKSET